MITHVGMPAKRLSEQPDEFLDGESCLIDDLAQRSARAAMVGNNRPADRVVGMLENAVAAFGANVNESCPLESAHDLARLE